MFLRPEAHHGEYRYGTPPDGYSVVGGPEIEVERQDDCRGVLLLLDPLTTETIEDRRIERLLTPEEARELAAMLRHHADEADRRLGLR